MHNVNRNRKALAFVQMPFIGAKIYACASCLPRSSHCETALSSGALFAITPSPPMMDATCIVGSSFFIYPEIDEKSKNNI